MLHLCPHKESNYRPPRERRYVRATVLRAAKALLSVTRYAAFIALILGFGTVSLVAAADQATATSHIQIIKTASVQARVNPASELAMQAADSGNQSIPICLIINAPFSVSADESQQYHLTDAASDKTINFQALLENDSIRNKSTDCQDMHNVDVSINQSQWNTIKEGRYAGSLRLMVVIE